MRTLLPVVLFFIFSFHSAWGETSRLYVIQMGDFHSHFHTHAAWGGEPDPSVARGGAANVKTAIKEFISKNNLTNQEVLIVDSGDWSEGSIFYKDGLGIASLQMLDLLGVAVSVLGNHDFYNGPDVLDNTIKASEKSFPILAANLKYPNSNIAKRLSDKVQIAFKTYKPSFASTNAMTFFTRLFLTLSDVPNDVDQNTFNDKLSLFIKSLRETSWFNQVGSKNKNSRLVNVTNIDSLLEESKEQETKDSLWKFWSEARKKVENGDINKFVLDMPAIADSFLIPKTGSNVCLFGIVTHEMVYQHFFDPVKIEVPYPIGDNQIQLSVAEKEVKNLRESKGCDFVIALTHQTDQNDRVLAETVDGIDMILGGHSHNHINPPIKVVNKKSGREVPIFKAGKFGEMLSTFSIKHSNESGVEFSDFKNVEIVPNQYAPDKDVEEFIRNSVARVEEIDGKNSFKSKVVDSEISLERFVSAESPFGNYLTSSIRYALENMSEPVSGVDLVLISPFFISSDLSRGEIFESDLFNLLSLVYRPEVLKSWRIATVDMSGKSLRTILNALFERGMVSATDERASIIFEPATVLHPFIELKIKDSENGEFKPLQEDRIYRLALPEGIVDAFHVIQEVLKDVSFENEIVYDIELWEALAKYLTFHKKLTADKVQISQRLSSLSPDLSLSRKDLKVYIFKAQKRLGARVTVTILNNGQSQSEAGEVSLFIDSKTPYNISDNGPQCGTPVRPRLLDGETEDQIAVHIENYNFNRQLYRHWEELSSLTLVEQKSIPPIEPGQSIDIEFDVKLSVISSGARNLSDLPGGAYPILVTAALPEGRESVTENNRVEGLLLVP